MAIEVVKPGLSTSVQDLGRPGYYHLGIPISGAMDLYSLRAATLLVGNDTGDAALEAVFMGPELRFTDDRTVAVTGADLPPKLDGVEQPTWTALHVKAGQVLSFGYLKSGARAYIAISGGIDVPVVLGSRSSYLLGALGGFEGRTLKAGDVLPLGPAKQAVRPGRSVASELRSPVALPAKLRVVTGLYWDRSTKEAGERFFADTWKVAPEADRIGYRFRGGRPLAFNPREQPFGAGSDPSNIVDSCYPYGSIQILAERNRSCRTATRFPAADIHDRHRHLGRHGRDRPAPAEQPDPVRSRRHGGRTAARRERATFERLRKSLA